ncbi:hypothetical protein TELCIR_13209 [Teladorsagia circumcincta]|uniref:SXP/RAL-2 family protein Ani s 5-like cation-binding domain-containing protein n=1 Tax=Teladorsagia circumcincta TaxID=45464 RepID=A0A2G9U4C9_TELCI|nr:hypothetical protein TELCIR_13209 [Teladorsagia circumcincta]
MGDHMGHGCHKSSTMMPFLKNVSSEARKQYAAILKSNETIAQQNEDIMNWAKAHGVKDELDEYNENMVRLKQELKRNFTSLVSDLPQALAEFFNITENEDQTQAGKKAALKELKNRNPKVHMS